MLPFQSFNMESERLKAVQSQNDMTSQALTQMILSSSTIAVGDNLESSLSIVSELLFIILSVLSHDVSKIYGVISCSKIWVSYTAFAQLG